MLPPVARAPLVLSALLVSPGALASLSAAEEHGLSQKAVEIATPFGFPVTNSMVVTWI